MNELSKVKEDNPFNVRRSWNKQEESRCDLKDCVSVHRRKDYTFFSLWKKTTTGRSLTEIKRDPEMIKLFADKSIRLIKEIVGLNSVEGWCIITSPKRRNRMHNFSSKVCKAISSNIGFPFYDNLVFAKNRRRINPVFVLQDHVIEKNIILWDDIITTGSTIGAIRDLLKDKNIITICAINNN